MSDRETVQEAFDRLHDAMADVGNELVKALHIPQILEWLERRLSS